MIVLAAGMQKSATGLSFEIINRLVAASSNGSDVRAIKKRMHLEKLLRHHNCNVGKLTLNTFRQLKAIQQKTGTFVVKSHERFSNRLLPFFQKGDFKVIYSYRDPRDVVISAFESGKKLRDSKGFNLRGFSKLISIEISIIWVYLKLIPVFNFYHRVGSVYMFKYEDFINNRQKILSDCREYLNLEVELSTLEKYMEKDMKSAGTHFNIGVAGRHKSMMTGFQLKISNWLFSSAIKKMGYKL